MTFNSQITNQKDAQNFNFCSSTADDVWHPKEKSSAYEWWYFDAISDDERDVLVIIFLDNFIFSPRYNAFCAKNSNLTASSNNRFPALAFVFYRDGKPLYRALNEFPASDFLARTDFPSCQIGGSRFDFEATPYGIRYILKIDVILRGNLKLTASLEWLIIERDFAKPTHPLALSDAHFWNLVSSRSDVTGKIAVTDANGFQVNQIQFRGTGYHDHNVDSRWLPATVKEWQWGRAHFADATAIFYRYLEIGDKAPATKLFLIKEENFSAHDAVYASSGTRRNRFGVKYSHQLEFLTGKDFSLSVAQNQLIDSSFFYLRFLSDMKLDLGDGKTRETFGITEHLAPQSLRWRWIDWLVNMRIGRDGRGSFLP